jgi:glucose/arabinose dehydrogenase
MRNACQWMGATLGFCLLVGATASAETALTTERVAAGLSSPVFVTAPPADTVRLFIVEKPGVIKILDLDSGTVNATPFLDIDSLVGGGNPGGDERGLLGLAFAPDYATSGRFYVFYTNTAFDTVLARYEVSADPDVADPASAEVLLVIDQPEFNHNGGWIAFGPDGYLYLASGDGGSSCDPDENAQNINNLLGVLLRLDVSVPSGYAIPIDNPFIGVSGDDEIWAYGLRNPWRNAFDRVTSELYIADVGQGAWEEINIQPAASSGAENYGWDCREGMHCATDSNCPAGDVGCDCNDPFLTDPAWDYARGGSPFRCAITGGYVYRGCAIPDLRGAYFYADYCSDQIWSFRHIDGAVTDLTERTTALAPGGGLDIDRIVSFGEDARGELYIIDLGNGSNGEVYRVIAAGPVDAPTPFDYDNDGTIDDFDTHALFDCVTGPGGAYDNCLCDVFDDGADGDIDLHDVAGLQRAL